MVLVDVAVPTSRDLSIEFTVDVDEARFPDGSEIERDLTVIVGGWPGRPSDEILGVVFPTTDERTNHGTSAQSADDYPRLTRAIQTAIASHLVQNRED